MIIELFFKQHLKVNEIAEKVDTSSAYITKNKKPILDILKKNRVDKKFQN